MAENPTLNTQANKVMQVTGKAQDHKTVPKGPKAT